jgi:hypothetical protein
MNLNKSALYVSALASIMPLIGFLLFVHAQNSYIDPHWGKVWNHGAPRILDIMLISMPGVFLVLLYYFLGKYSPISKAILIIGGIFVLLSITVELFVTDLKRGDDVFVVMGVIRYLLVFVLYVVSTIYFLVIKYIK